MEVGTGGDPATQSPSSVAMVLADATPPNAKPPAAAAESSTSRGTTAATRVAQERNGADLCVAEKIGVNAAPPRSGPPDAFAGAPTTPQTPVSSVRYVGDNAERTARTDTIAEPKDAEEDDGSSSSSEDDNDDEAEYERTPTGAAAQFLPPDTTDAYQESPVKFRPVVVLEKESQRSPRKMLMEGGSSGNEYVEGARGRSADASGGLEDIGLPTIDEAMMGPSSGNENKGSGTRPPVSGSAAGKNSINRKASRRSTASGSSGRGGSGRTSTTNTTGGDILSAILDRTLTFMGCASTSNAFGCGRTTGSQRRSAASCRCGGGGGSADDQVWDGDVDDTATVNSVHVPSPRGSPKHMADLNGRVQIQMRTSAAAGDTSTSSAVAQQAARAAAAASDMVHNHTNHKKNIRGIPTGGCTGTGGKYVASSPLTTTVPFDANDLSTIVPDAADAHHVSPKKPATASSGGNGPASLEADKKKDGDNGDDDDDEALLSPTHFFRPVSFDIDESSLAGSIAGSLASAIRGVR